MRRYWVLIHERMMFRYINSQGGRTGYWLSLLSLVAAGAILNLIPSPHQVGVGVTITNSREVWT